MNINGVINIDKPISVTSHDVIYSVRRILSMKKVGHVGTLDPLASGVLPVCVGKGTKAAEYLSADDKVYLATLKLGIETDTEDITGQIIKTSSQKVKTSQIIDVCKTLTGEVFQTPPMYSAIKKNGQKLYDLARKGIETVREPRRITIYSIDLLSQDPQKREYDLRISCSKGTYIRTICADIGKILGVGGVMSALRREKSGIFEIKDSITVEKLEQMAILGDVSSLFISVEKIFSTLPRICVDSTQAALIKNGMILDISRLADVPKTESLHTVYFGDEFLMLARPDFLKSSLVMEKSFY